MFNSNVLTTHFWNEIQLIKMKKDYDRGKLWFNKFLVKINMSITFLISNK